MFDPQINKYVHAPPQLGMRVEVLDPDDDRLMSRVNQPIIASAVLPLASFGVFLFL